MFILCFSDEHEVAIVYFRDGETAENYPSEKVGIIFFFMIMYDLTI